ncbi:uncharacterized protein LOC144139563 [Haemaphysalis longicornis]
MMGMPLFEENIEREEEDTSHAKAGQSPQLATPTTSMLSFLVPLVLVIGTAFVFSAVLKPLQGTAPYHRQARRRPAEGNHTAIKAETFETSQHTVGDATTSDKPGERATDVTVLTIEEEWTSKVTTTKRKKPKPSVTDVKITQRVFSTKRTTLQTHHLGKKTSKLSTRKHEEQSRQLWNDTIGASR